MTFKLRQLLRSISLTSNISKIIQELYPFSKNQMFFNLRMFLNPNTCMGVVLTHLLESFSPSLVSTSSISMTLDCGCAEVAVGTCMDTLVTKGLALLAELGARGSTENNSSEPCHSAFVRQERWHLQILGKQQLTLITSSVELARVKGAVGLTTPSLTGAISASAVSQSSSMASFIRD